MTNKIFSRRELIKTTGKSVVGIAMAGAIPGFLMGCSEQKPTASIDATQGAPTYPFKYSKLDPTKAMERGYAGYYDVGGCCRGVADAIIGQLSDDVGYPFNQIPIDAFANGTTGYGLGTLCGALGGAVLAIGLVCEPDTAKEVTKQLFDWYQKTEFPIYQPKMELQQTVANSVNCIDSVGKYMEKTGVAMGDPERKERCACLSGDVAAKTVELLNAHFAL